MHGDRRKEAILIAGLELARSSGMAAVTARGIGLKLGLSHAGILYHHKSSAALRDAVAAFAVQEGDRAVVPQLITANHPAAAGLSQEQRQAYLSGC